MYCRQLLADSNHYQGTAVPCFYTEVKHFEL
jgi:hypothetical protein